MKKFPLIAEHIGQSSGAFTVCFVNETEGIVVKSKNKMCEIGYYAKEWASCFNKYEWRIIAQPSEYPKEMYVNMKSEEIALQNKNKRTIVFNHEGTVYIDTEGYSWEYAVDIPEQSNENQEIQLGEVHDTNIATYTVPTMHLRWYDTGKENHTVELQQLCIVNGESEWRTVETYKE